MRLVDVDGQPAEQLIAARARDRIGPGREAGERQAARGRVVARGPPLRGLEQLAHVERDREVAAGREAHADDPELGVGVLLDHLLLRHPVGARDDVEVVVDLVARGELRRPRVVVPARQHELARAQRRHVLDVVDDPLDRLLRLRVCRALAVEHEHQLAQRRDRLDHARHLGLARQPLELEHLEVQRDVRLVAELDAQHHVAERAEDRLVVDHALTPSASGRRRRPQRATQLPQHLDDPVDDLHRARPVAVHAHALGLELQRAAIHRLDRARLEEAPDGRLGAVRVHRLAAVLDDGLAVRAVARVGVVLPDDRDAAPGAGAQERAVLRAGRPVQHRLVHQLEERVHRGGGEVVAGVQHRVERPVRLHVVEPQPVRAQEGLERARLVDDVGVEVGGRQVHRAPAEAEQVGHPRV